MADEPITAAQIEAVPAHLAVMAHRALQFEASEDPSVKTLAKTMREQFHAARRAARSERIRMRDIDQKRSSST